MLTVERATVRVKEINMQVHLAPIPVSAISLLQSAVLFLITSNMKRRTTDILGSP